MKVTVLGVKIDDINMEEAISIVENWLSKSGKPFDETQGKHYIVTPNPEFLVTAQKDRQFKKILNDSDLAIPDGVGLKLGGVKNTVSGTDLMEKLVGLAAKKGYTVGFLGGRNGIAEKVAECLRERYKNLQITFANDGRSWNIEDGTLKMENRRWKNKNLSSIVKTDIIFVAFGHPKQEYWIAENLDKNPVKVAMGVGGAFDYISGNVPRAPLWMRKIGMEWLFRLIIQPWRIKRQIALIKYIWLLTHRSD